MEVKFSGEGSPRVHGFSEGKGVLDPIWVQHAGYPDTDIADYELRLGGLLTEYRTQLHYGWRFAPFIKLR